MGRRRISPFLSFRTPRSASIFLANLPGFIHVPPDKFFQEGGAVEMRVRVLCEHASDKLLVHEQLVICIAVFDALAQLTARFAKSPVHSPDQGGLTAQGTTHGQDAGSITPYAVANLPEFLRSHRPHHSQSYFSRLLSPFFF